MAFLSRIEARCGARRPPSSSPRDSRLCENTTEESIIDEREARPTALASLRGAGRFRVFRQCSTTCSLGQPRQVTLALETMTRRGRRLRLRDDVPAVFTTDPAELRVDVPGRGWVELESRVVPGRRGTYAFERVDALMLSRLGLWQRSISWRPSGETRRHPPCPSRSLRPRPPRCDRRV